MKDYKTPVRQFTLNALSHNPDLVVAGFLEGLVVILLERLPEEEADHYVKILNNSCFDRGEL